MWKSAAASIARFCADLCVDDRRRQRRDDMAALRAVRKIAWKATKMGRVGVLEWAGTNGFQFDWQRRDETRAYGGD